jgi:hypothetical protein
MGKETLSNYCCGNYRSNMARKTTILSSRAIFERFIDTIYRSLEKPGLFCFF